MTKKLTLSLNNDKPMKGHCQRNDPKIPDLIYHCFVSMVQLGNVQWCLVHSHLKPEYLIDWIVGW